MGHLPVGAARVKRVMLSSAKDPNLSFNKAWSRKLQGHVFWRADKSAGSVVNGL